MSDFDELMGMSRLDLVAKVQRLESERDKLRKEHRAMSKGAQTNAEVVKKQAAIINELRKLNDLPPSAKQGKRWAVRTKPP